MLTQPLRKGYYIWLKPVLLVSEFLKIEKANGIFFKKEQGKFEIRVWRVSKNRAPKNRGENIFTVSAQIQWSVGETTFGS